MVPSIRSLATEFEGRAALVTVYTVEAHAQDEWPISSCRFNRKAGVSTQEPVCVQQPRSNGARLQLAESFIADFAYPGTMVVDPPEAGSPFEAAFSCWPFRFFGVTWADGQPVLSYIAHPRNCGYSAVELRDWLLTATVGTSS
jgi:hypothetical protein